MKAINQTARLLVITGMIILAAAIYSCTENKDGGTGNVSVASGDANYIVVSGEEHTLATLVTSPLLRSPLREYIYSMTMLKKAREAGIEVSDEEVAAQIEETKLLVDQRNTTWQHFLDNQFLTEEEYYLNTKYSLMFERLVESRVEITEEDKLDIWDTQQASVIDEYLSENHLPESERSSVEYEMVESICEERAMNSLKQGALIEVRTEIVRESTIELPFLEDADERQMYEDLILNMAREAQEESGDSRMMPGTVQ